MTYKHHKINLKDYDISVNDLITIEHRTGTIDYVPVFILDLMTEKLKAKMSKLSADGSLYHSIDLAEFDIKDLMTP